jgi:hypothetical protein
MRIAGAAVGLLGLWLAVQPFAGATGVTIEHRGVACVAADRFPSFEAKLLPLDEVARARLYFRAGSTPHWYFVEMTADGGLHRAVLPKPKKSLERFDYFIEATDKALGTSRTADFSAAVSSGARACPGGLPLAASAAAARVEVAPLSPTAGVPAVPPGFASTGVVMASAGSATSASGAAGAAGTGGGISSKAVMLGAAGAAAVAGGVALAVSGGEDSTDVTGQSRFDAVVDVRQSAATLASDWVTTRREASGPGYVPGVATDLCDVGSVGQVERYSIPGTISGNTVSFVITGAGAVSHRIEITGTLQANVMSGTISGTNTEGWPESGTWSLTRQ